MRSICEVIVLSKATDDDELVYSLTSVGLFTMSPPIHSTPKTSVSVRASSRLLPVGSNTTSSPLSSPGAMIPLSSITSRCLVSPLAKSIMSVGAAISASISTGIRMVVMMNDFLRTRSLNSRAMIMLILFIVVMFYCMGRVVRLSMLFQSLPSTARMNMSFMLGITSLNERRLTASFTAATMLRTDVVGFSLRRVVW